MSDFQPSRLPAYNLQNICQNLATFGTIGHERIQLVKDQEGNYYPRTTSKPRWLGWLISCFFKWETLRVKTVAQFVLEFFEAHKEELEAIKSLNETNLRKTIYRVDLFLEKGLRQQESIRWKQLLATIQELINTHSLSQDISRIVKATTDVTLGICYELGIAKDPAKAFSFYQSAAQEDDIAAIVSLGRCYEKGIGVDKDPKKAFELFKQAADLGNPDGQFHLGACYEFGIGTEIDLDEATKLYRLAEAQGHEEAKERLEKPV